MIKIIRIRNSIVTYLKYVIIFGCVMFVCCAVTRDARFPGGEKALERYLIMNMQWQNEHLTYEGSVFVTFEVNEGGAVYNTKIIKGLCKSCDYEAIRLVSTMPNWLPAMKNGQPIKSKVAISVRFSL